MTSPPRSMARLQIISQKCSLGDSLPNYIKRSAPLNKMASIAENPPPQKKKKTKKQQLQIISPPRPIVRFQNYFTEMFLG